MKEPSHEPNQDLCDECDSLTPDVYCQACAQYLCSNCDLKIHNKAKRALHERITLKTKLVSLELFSTQRTTLCTDKIFYNDSLLVTYAQP